MERHVWTLLLGRGEEVRRSQREFAAVGRRKAGSKLTISRLTFVPETKPAYCVVWLTTDRDVGKLPSPYMLSGVCFNKKMFIDRWSLKPLKKNHKTNKYTEPNKTKPVCISSRAPLCRQTWPFCAT